MTVSEYAALAAEARGALLDAWVRLAVKENPAAAFRLVETHDHRGTSWHLEKIPEAERKSFPGAEALRERAKA